MTEVSKHLTRIPFSIYWTHNKLSRRQYDNQMSNSHGITWPLYKDASIRLINGSVVQIMVEQNSKFVVVLSY